MDITIGIAFGILVGIIAALKVIAPKTKNKVDDKILAGAEKIETVVEPFVSK